jgi:sugar (pentulose or hexulose) kinase
MTGDALIGADLGTGSMKAILVDPAGRLRAEASREYPMHHPHPGWNENDPQDWVDAFVSCTRELADAARGFGLTVRALCLVSQRDPFVLVDAAGRPTTRSISWTDQRSAAQAQRLRELVGFDRLIDIAGARPITGLGLPNLLWTRHHLPDAWRDTVRFCAPKDYVLHEVFGVDGTDITTPTRSAAFDIRANRWSADILEPVGVPTELFDEAVHLPWQVCATVDGRVADRLGLPPGVLVAAGGADDQAATLGAGAVSAGQACLGTGTCSDWRLVLEQYEPDLSGQGDTAPHVVPDRFIREVTIDSAGSSLRWFRNELCRDLVDDFTYARLVALALSAPPGASGVHFFPYVAGGERAPYFQQGASGVFFGIGTHHGRAHLARAILEGITFLYPPTWALLTRGSSGTPLTMVDAEALSPGWTQLKADVLGQPIRVTEIASASALGAAILAATAAGLHPTVADAASEMVRFGATTEPNCAAHARYRELRLQHEQIFQTVRSVYGQPMAQTEPHQV